MVSSLPPLTYLKNQKIKWKYVIWNWYLPKSNFINQILYSKIKDLHRVITYLETSFLYWIYLECNQFWISLHKVCLFCCRISITKSVFPFLICSKSYIIWKTTLAQAPSSFTAKWLNIRDGTGSEKWTFFSNVVAELSAF